MSARRRRVRFARLLRASRNTGGSPVIAGCTCGMQESRVSGLESTLEGGMTVAALADALMIKHDLRDVVTHRTWLPLWRRLRRRRAVILTWHRFTDDPAHPDRFPVAMLRRQLEMLRRDRPSSPGAARPDREPRGSRRRPVAGSRASPSMTATTTSRMSPRTCSSPTTAR